MKRLLLVILFLTIGFKCVLEESEDFVASFIWLEERKIYLQEEIKKLGKRVEKEKEAFWERKGRFIPSLLIPALRRDLKLLYQLKKEIATLSELQEYIYRAYLSWWEAHKEKLPSEEKKMVEEDLRLMYYLLTSP
ncbi:MAG TPA: hypothetical protein ENG13_00310 [bacterium]|nr:hypothetical protein [bacterium]HEX67496.1 hypothetical protein [bacterium]